jgi:hypothetical protein
LPTGVAEFKKNRTASTVPRDAFHKYVDPRKLVIIRAGDFKR